MFFSFNWNNKLKIFNLYLLRQCACLCAEAQDVSRVLHQRFFFLRMFFYQVKYIRFYALRLKSALSGQTVSVLACWPTVPGSSPSLGKNPTLKTVIQLQGVHWPAGKSWLYHNSWKYEPVTFMRFFSVGECLGCWHGTHITYHTPHPITRFNSRCRMS